MGDSQAMRNVALTTVFFVLPATFEAMKLRMTGMGMTNGRDLALVQSGGQRGSSLQVETDQTPDTQVYGQFPYKARTDDRYRAGEQRGETSVSRLVAKPQGEDHDDGKPRVRHAE